MATLKLSSSYSESGGPSIDPTHLNMSASDTGNSDIPGAEFIIKCANSDCSLVVRELVVFVMTVLFDMQCD